MNITNTPNIKLFASNLYSTNPNNTVCKNEFNKDIFIKRNINFTANTSQGGFLRPITGLHDPYSHIILLTNKEMELLRFDIKLAPKTSDKIQVLSQCDKNMFDVEKKVYQLLVEDSAKNPKLGVSDILKVHAPKALFELKNEQDIVFNKIDELSENLSIKNKERIKQELEDARKRCKQPVDNKHHFKRKTFIKYLTNLKLVDILETAEDNILKTKNPKKAQTLKEINEIKTGLLNHNVHGPVKNGTSTFSKILNFQKAYAPETIRKKHELDDIISTAKTLTTSGDSVNAFIVKYQDRSDDEILTRLVEPSLLTIEHIHPDSKGGPDCASNFMAASKKMNNERGNMPLKDFIKMHPEIPECIQNYVDDIALKKNKRKLEGYEWYPYVLKSTLKREGNIDIDISKYQIRPKDAFKTIPKNIKNNFPEYAEYMPGAKQTSSIDYKA